MSKPVRFLMAGFIILAASALCATRTAQAVQNPALVFFLEKPADEICRDDQITVFVRYMWDMKSGEEPLAPLAPLDPKGKTNPPLPPGKLTLSGKLAGQIGSMNVGYGPATAMFTYAAKDKGEEELTASLTYGGYSDTASYVFEIVDCGYKLSIKAVKTEKQSNTSWWNMFSAEGGLIVDNDNTIHGQFQMSVWLDLSSGEKALSCELVPLVTSSGNVTVTGTKAGGKNTPDTVTLTVTYGQMSGFPSAKILCKDNIRNQKIPAIDFPIPADDYSKYLKTSLTFTGSMVTGSYSRDGKSGNSYYILEKTK
jgi:hypothetical protein